MVAVITFVYVDSASWGVRTHYTYLRCLNYCSITQRKSQKLLLLLFLHHHLGLPSLLFWLLPALAVATVRQIS